jgi:ribonuclease HI
MKKSKVRFKLYTDGSIDAKTGRGAYGWILICKNGDEDVITEEKTIREDGSTISVLEIKAVLDGLRSAIVHADSTEIVIVDVYSDSKMVVDSMNVYIPKWRRKAFSGGPWIATNGQPVANQDLFKEILSVEDGLTEVRYIHVKAHAESEYNNRIDKAVHDLAFAA